MKFGVSEEIFEKFPNVVEYIVIGQGVSNEVPSKEINDRLDDIAKGLDGKKDILNDPKYSGWVKIFNSVKKGYIPSHVALAKRAIEGKKIPHINPIVNLYNYYSLKYAIPIGGEDLSKVYGDMKLKFADGDELFLGIGDSRVENIEEGEVIWGDDHSVTCRMWAWRQSKRTKLTKNFKDVYFVIDTLSEFKVEPVMEEFVKDLKKYFGGDFQILKLSKGQNELAVKYKSKVLKSGFDTNKDLEQLIDTGKESKKKSDASLFQRRSKSMKLIDRDQLTQKISKMVEEILSEIGVGEKSDVSLSQGIQFGDFSSTVALREASKKGGKMNKIAEKIVESIKSSDLYGKVIKDVNLAENGFINLIMSENFLTNELTESVVKKDKFGVSDIGENRTILVESPSINPNAPAHTGHLRNLLIGRSLARLLEMVGFKVEIDNLINDKDNKICMALWGYQKYGEGKTPENVEMKPDHFVGKYYVLGRKAYNTDPKVKEDIDEMLKKLENNDEKMTKLWMKVTKWAFTGQLQTFERLNEEQGFLWFESELWEGGKTLIEKYIGKGVVERLEDGAVIGRIEDEYGVPDIILLRSDGTSVYHTQDLNLTLKKIEKFKPWKAIWVVGNEHILHFQRLFALLDKLKILSVDNLYAYVYGMVLGKDGKKISSRSGEDINADQLLDMARDAALKVLEGRDIDGKKKHEIAKKVGQGAIRFDILSKDAFKDIVLDIDKAVSFVGKSGSYVMYAYTRAQSILKKVGKVEKGELKDVNIGDIERSLLLKLLNYPEAVLSAANTYSPSIVADYSYEVATLFNNFYENCPVIKAGGSQKAFRKALTGITANVLKGSLGILGVEVIEEM